MSRVVLVVDEEPLILAMTASMLEDLGCEVVTAPNAPEALARLSADPRVEILITDVNMPGMDGYELAEKAKRVREGLGVSCCLAASEMVPTFRLSESRS